MHAHRSAKAARHGPGNALLRVTMVAATVCAAQASALAQTVEELRNLSIEDLANIEVTSVSRRAEPLSQAPAAVFVISASDIRRSGATTLPEALRLAPNLEVARLNAFTYTITARGFNSPESANKLLVLIDGRSVYSPLGSTVFWEAVNVDLDDVERIEVVSGPGGTLYGANAVNGVINVITRSSGDTQGGLADLGGGNKEARGTLRYGGRLGSFGTWRVYGTGFAQDRTSPVLPGDQSTDTWHGGQAGFRADGSTGDDAFTLQGDLYNNQVDASVEKLWGGNVLGRWTRRLGAASTFALQAYYSDDVRWQPGLKDSLETYDLQAQHNLTVGAHELVTGAEFRAWREGIFSAGPFLFPTPEATLYLGNVFGQDTIALRSDLKLTVGTKFEANTFSGLDVLPNVRLGWQAAQNAFLWSAVSRAVRTPSRIDRELQAAGFLAPSPGFRSEKLTAFELGFRAQPLPRATMSASAYYDLYDDIRTDEFTAGGLPIVLGNGIEGDTYGIEIWGSYDVLDWWRLKPGFNWLHKNLHLKPGHNDFSQFQAAGQDPAYQAQLRSEMNVSETVELDAALRLVGPVSRPPLASELVSSYVEADARIGWHVTRAVELSLDGSNLLHSRHIEAFDPSTTAPRYISRTVFARLRTQF